MAHPSAIAPEHKLGKVFEMRLSMVDEQRLSAARMRRQEGANIPHQAEVIRELMRAGLEAEEAAAKRKRK